MSEPRELPPGWAWATFSDVAEVASDLIDPRTVPDAIHIAPNHIEPKTGELIALGRVSDDSVISPKHRFSPGQILYSKIRPYLAKAVVATIEGVCSADMYPVDCRIETRYLWRWMLTDQFTDAASGEQGRTLLPKINQIGLAKIHVPVAPLAEQRRIVAKLDELLARSRRAREALAEVPALVARYRESVLAAAFRGDLTADWREANPAAEPASALLERIRVERRRRWEEAELAKLTAKGKAPKDDRWRERYEEPTDTQAQHDSKLPSAWSWARWESLGFSQNGRPFPSVEYQDEGVKLLRPGNLFPDGSVRWTASNTKCLPRHHEEENADLVVRGGELVMNLTAQSLKDAFLGRTCLTAPGEHCLLNQRLARLTPVVLDASYVLWMFKSPLVRSYIDELNTGTMIQHMFTSQVNRIVLPVAPLAEQREIVRRVEAAFARIDAVEAAVAEQRARLDAYDRSLLARAFAGELVPQDPADEPAAALLARLRAERGEAAPARGRKRRGEQPQ